MAESRDDKIVYATYAIYASANFYIGGMACLAMDAESYPNDGIKMHNENFTKNDVRKVRNVRILRNLTFLSANFYIGGMACRAMDDVRRNAAGKTIRLREKPLGECEVTPSGMEREGNIYYSKLRP